MPQMLRCWQSSTSKETWAIHIDKKDSPKPLYSKIQCAKRTVAPPCQFGVPKGLRSFPSLLILDKVSQKFDKTILEYIWIHNIIKHLHKFQSLDHILIRASPIPYWKYARLVVLYVEIKLTNCHSAERCACGVARNGTWSGIHHRDFGGDCLVRVSEPWGHGDVIFFWGHSCYIYFWSRIFTFLCFNIHLSRRNPGENPAPCWYSRSLIGWLGFLTLPIWDLAGILPERLRGSPQHKLTGHVGGWWNIGDTQMTVVLNSCFGDLLQYSGREIEIEQK